MAVSKRLRHEVMRRDGHACRYCGATAPDVKLTIDHVTPTTLGGTDEPSNLVTACADCNAGKSATPPDAALVAAVDERAVQWSQAMQVAVEQRAAELADERGRTDRFEREWLRWNAGDQEVWRDANWRASILRLLAAGLTDEFLIDAVGIAMRSKVKPSDTWRYFCGVCWREVDKIQTAARRIADGARPAPPSGAVFPLPRTFSEDDLVPQHQVASALHPYFPSINVSTNLTKMLLRNSGVPDDVVERVGVMLWAGQQAAYKAFLDGLAKDPSSDGISAAWDYMDHAIDGRVESLLAELEARLRESWSEAKPDPRLPSGPGLHPGFDALNLTDSYIADLFQHLGIYDERAAWAHRGYWTAMEDAYRVFIAGDDDTCASDSEATMEQFDMSAAYFLNQVWMASGRPTWTRRDDDEGDA